MAWAQTHGIRHILIEPGRPMQNGSTSQTVPMKTCNGPVSWELSAFLTFMLIG